MKLSFDQWTLVIGGAIILYLMFLNVQKENADVCEEYFEEPCYKYSIPDKICTCESGDYRLTKFMINERNKEITELNRALREFDFKVWQDSYNPPNLSKLTVDDALKSEQI